MPENGDKTVRINIYVHDPQIRTRVKEAAAREGQSMSEYCLEAILARLTEKEIGSSQGGGNIPEDAVEKMLEFQKKVFGDLIFSVSAAELVREGRDRR